jgi:ELWxxDGT repeat protein
MSVMETSRYRGPAAVSLALLAALIVSGLGADEPYLVRDIDPGAGLPLGSDPRLVQAADGPAFLFAADEDHGRELWITDGTEAGTRLLRDVCSGRCSSDPMFQVFLGSRMLFSARTAPDDVPRLWISDGTWAGTRPLGSGAVGTTAAVGVIEDGGLFLFGAEHGGETGLWVTDGSAGGTRPLALDGPDGWPRFPYGGISGTGRLVFGSRASDGGDLTWITDGTDAGTLRLAAIPRGQHPARVNTLERLGNRTAVFVNTRAAFDCETELWFTDGTAAGTVRLLTFDQPQCDQPTRFLRVAEADGALWFTARHDGEPAQLWRTDGTPAGTRPVTSVTGDVFVDQPIVADGDAVLFAVFEELLGREPWIADAAGARLLADICPGRCSSSPSFGWNPGALYFSADNGLNGIELWRREGDAAVLVEDACPGECDSLPLPLGVAGGQAFFIAGEPLGTPGRELWATTVGGNGAERLTDFATDNPFPFHSGFRFSAAAVADRLLFTADDGEHGIEVWRSDGSSAGTALGADVEPRRESGAGSDPILLTPDAGRVLFFAREPDVGYQPWVSDGTPSGTQRVGIVIDPSLEPSSFPPFTPPFAAPVALGGSVLFLAHQGSEDILSLGGATELWRVPDAGAPVRLGELVPDGPLPPTSGHRVGGRAVFLLQPTSTSVAGVWSSDGTAAGTQRLGEVRVSGTGGRHNGQALLGGHVYFGGAPTGSLDWDLWRTDGTPGGTVPVGAIEPLPAAADPAEFAVLGDRLLFAANTFFEGRELWTTDGTAAGTRMVAAIVPGNGSSFPRGLTTVGDRVFFFVFDGVGGAFSLALWTSDGTAEGTVRVAEVPGFFFLPPEPNKIAATGDRLFFVADAAGFVPELWVSDGTAAGTGSLRPLFPPSAEVLEIWSAGDRVWVSLSTSDDLASSWELWESDGTFAGTRRLFALPRVGGQPVAELTQLGSLLFFQGPHPEAGAELMALPLGPPAPCSADPETLCLGNGRFAVRAHWRDPRTGDSGTAGALPFPGSDRTGLFWFFHPDNIELVVKNLDGGPVNGWFWNFYGGLSDVEYRIEVVDTATGRRVEYHNPEGEICGRGDTTAFLSREPVPLPVPPQMPAPAVAAAPAPGTGSECGGGPGALCLLDDRFRVEVEWTDQRSGDSGVGTAVPGTDRSGFFWFFNQTNIELVVKMLDGRQVNGRFWVFYGALSDVEYAIRVTDTETGTHKEYRNPPGEICGRGDTAAF